MKLHRWVFLLTVLSSLSFSVVLVYSKSNSPEKVTGVLFFLRTSKIPKRLYNEKGNLYLNSDYQNLSYLLKTTHWRNFIFFFLFYIYLNRCDYIAASLYTHGSILFPLRPCFFFFCLVFIRYCYLLICGVSFFDSFNSCLKSWKTHIKVCTLPGCYVMFCYMYMLCNIQWGWIYLSFPALNIFSNSMHPIASLLSYLALNQKKKKRNNLFLLFF